MIAFVAKGSCHRARPYDPLPSKAITPEIAVALLRLGGLSSLARPPTTVASCDRPRVRRLLEAWVYAPGQAHSRSTATVAPLGGATLLLNSRSRAVGPPEGICVAATSERRRHYLAGDPDVGEGIEYLWGWCAVRAARTTVRGLTMRMGRRARLSGS
jgi:hypothetical protein